MKTKIGVCLLSSVLLSCSLLSSQTLDRNVLKSIYGDYLRENGREEFDLSKTEFKWEQGSFAAHGNRDAVVQVNDMANMSHADGYSKIFYFSYDGSWELIDLIAQGDVLSFKTVDIENDGVREVWIEGSGGNQGYFFSFGKLFSLAGGKFTVLYENDGLDNMGALKNGEEGEAFIGHKVSFQDLDHDGVLELIDLVEAKTIKNQDYEFIEKKIKSEKQTFKLQNDKFVLWKPTAAKNTIISDAGASNPVGFAKQEIERLKLLWEPLMYTSIFGVYRIGGALSSLGVGYILLESPAIAVDLVSGGPLKVLQSATFSLSLHFVEELVKSPRAACRSLVRETIDRGWSDYKTAYEIVKKYRQGKTLSCPDALRFLAARYGADKMTLANNLRYRIGSAGYSLPAAAADKAVREIVSSLDAKWQGKLGIASGETLPLSEAAFFIRDVTEVMREKKLGLLSYAPYLEFMRKMEPINKGLIDEGKKYGCTGGSRNSGSTGTGADTASEAFPSFFARFKSDETFQRTRIEFPLKYISGDPTNDDDSGTISYVAAAQWEFERFISTENDIWKEPELKGDEAIVYYQVAGTGISISHHFHRIAGKWFMWKIENWSM